MKTFKKALSIILGVAMILSCVAGMQISASAEGNALALSVGEAIVADGVVTVPVVVDSNTGFQALAITVNYDNTVLQLVGADKNNEFAVVAAPGNEVPAEVGATSPDFKKIMWAYVTDTDVTATGTIATLTFNVVEGATAESTDITLAVNEAWNVAGDEVAVGTKDGKVTFKKEIITNTALRYKTSAYVADKFGFYADFSRAQLDTYDDFYIEVATEHYRMTDTERYKKVTEVVKYKVISEGENAEGYLPQYEIMDKTYRFLITGVTGYEMTLNTTITIYCYQNGEITEKSSDFTFTYASVLEAAMPTASDKLKTAIVDLVNYGTESQKFFANDASNAGSDLAKSTVYPNANFADYDNYATKDEVIKLSDISDNSTFTVNPEKSLAPNNEVVDKLDLFIETSNVIRFGFNPRSYGLENINFKVKYTDSYGNVLDVDVARNELEPVGTSGVSYKYGSIALYDSNVKVTVEYYDGADLLATRVISINDIAAKNANNSALTDILNCLVKLGYSTNQLFFG